jgi:hypothetical protein
MSMDEVWDEAGTGENETDGWPALDRTAFSVASLSDESDEKAYWLSKTPQERLQAVELMRRMNYGYDRASARLQRVLEIVCLHQ